MPLQLSANARDANDLRYRSAVARGEWQVDGQIFIDNKIDAGGRAGYHVITPLKLADSTANILVNRGWIARANTYPAPPTVITPPGEVTVSGMIAQPNARFLELSADISAGKVWQNLTIARYVQATKLDVLPFVLIANAPVELGLVQVSERPDAGVAKHVEYMLTWYSLAATVIILWVALNLRITRSNAPSSAPA